MARSRKRRSSTKKRQRNFAFSPQLIGIIFIGWSLLGLFQAGYLGIACLNVFRLLIGDLAITGLILLLLVGFYLLARGKEPPVSTKVIGSLLLLYSGGTLWLTAFLFARLNLHTRFLGITWQYLWADLSSASAGSSVGGGVLGSLWYTASYFLTGQFGSYVLAILLLLGGICYLTGISLTKTLHFVLYNLTRAIGWLGLHLKPLVNQLGQKIGQLWRTWRRKRRQNKQSKNDRDLPVQESSAISKESQKLPVKPIDEVATKNDKEVLKTSIQTGDWQQDLNQKVAVTTEQPTPKLQTNVVADDYQLPPKTLLQQVKPTDQSAEYKKIEHNNQILQQTFKSFGVDVEIKKAILGPAVTKYELHPAVGVKVSKIVNLTDDLALALAAKDLRIEAPIPGKSLVGIEVPNQQVSTISFRSIIEEQVIDANHPLQVPLGRDISGKVVTADLQKMPHLLIAGSTGSGKSVAINCIITSLLMNCRPDLVKLMLIDPKKVELGVYNGVPHLLTPVVTDARKAAKALNKLVAEMERRYELFANTGQRNLKGYNEMVERQNQETGSQEPLMPYVVIVVDELSDLMMAASNEVESAIIRLAQMARAAGIHMILATQRPSVDVITGLIKANVPSRMAFAVSSGTDSRTIIDTNGAEKLLGRGDMLFLPMGMNKPVRVQGAFISDQDVAKVVDFIKEQQTADYDDQLLVTDEETENSEDEQPEDELFADVVKLITHEQACSISMLQRRFRIGYNRAARLVDELEAKGMVGPAEGSKPRKVYLEAPPSDQQ
ncbi:DNA translocase FtsK [Liquorilactobacillus nagelii]|uniref:DNA translocase FtsK n=1 Tax=Liquorilactobacillus nagelii TaxID=82688 RepID=UPI00242C21F0|nr:DNA translocase FtsK [Liquorilactobacillus nagelii]MCI1699584.1 DNA translocase FtsK [Liquorilactobacillus nagelii]